MTRSPLTLGTAGHIDHGKSALIKALTGTDTDRLPEEHARGISIELGYASLVLPSGARLSIVDVPGHERYVRTMVAGASGVDLYLMAIAADDGVMPQTREHAAVLRALHVSIGVVAVTKSDMADPELAMLEAEELLPGAEVVAVSARTGAGLGELRAALERAVSGLSGRAPAPGTSALARLHVDRAFTMRGSGTVVTGTLWSGVLTRGDQLDLLPGRRRARAREVQGHDVSVERAAAGQRVAVNLSGVGLEQVGRGDVVTSAGGSLAETYRFDAELEFGDREPDPGARVQIHHGTRETPARLAWLGGRFWQVRLEHALIPAGGDRFVVRQIAPPDTLGGGRVLDPHPRKHGPSRALLERLTKLARGEPLPDPPTAAPMPRPASPLPRPLGAGARSLEARLLASGFEPPLDSELDPEELAALREAGRAVRVNRTLHYHPDTLNAAREHVLAIAARHGGAITIAQLRNELGTSRKFAQALLEHFDAERVTLRRGDAHVVRRAAREG